MSDSTRRSFLKKAGLLAGLAVASPKDLIKELDRLSKRVSKHGQSIHAQEIAKFFRCTVIEVDYRQSPDQNPIIPYHNYKGCKHVTYRPSSGLTQEKAISKDLMPAMIAVRNQMELDKSKGQKILPTLIFRQGFDPGKCQEMYSIIYYLI